MLSEQVCRKCHCLSDPKNGEFLWDVGLTPMNGHEAFVERGVVWCPTQYVSGLSVVDVNTTPPVWCPYKLEHGVAFAEKDVEHSL